MQRQNEEEDDKTSITYHGSLAGSLTGSFAGSVLGVRFDRLELMFAEFIQRQADLQSDIQSQVGALQSEVRNCLERLELSPTFAVGSGSKFEP